MKLRYFFTIWQRRSLGWRFLLSLLLGVAIALGVQQVFALDTDQLPALQPHPLPLTLANGSDSDRDYFAEIEPSPVGYLIWSDFPVKVYLTPIDTNASLSEQRRQQQWYDAVQQAIAAWDPYLPLTPVDEATTADIVIERRFPAAQKITDPTTGTTRYSFARNAETRYQFYLDREQTLRHRMTVILSPHQGAIATQNTARHEIGHALGIWGHSPNPKDALFMSQNGQSSSITETDINTLKKIYQQPTRLGWKMPQSKHNKFIEKAYFLP